MLNCYKNASTTNYSINLIFHAARVASASCSNDGSQGIQDGSRSSLSSVFFFMWGILNLLQPFTFIASIKTPCSVRNIRFARRGEYSKKAYKTIVQEMNEWPNLLLKKTLKYVWTIWSNYLLHDWNKCFYCFCILLILNCLYSSKKTQIKNVEIRRVWWLTN